MPRELFDADGNKVEVPTDEELQQQREEQAQKIKAEAESSWLKDKEDLESKNKELSDNLSKQRQKFKTEENEGEKKTESELEVLRSQLSEKDEELRNFVVGSARDEAIREVAGDDDELFEAIKSNYDRINSPEGNRDQVVRRVLEAAAITEAQVVSGSDMVNDAVNSGGSGRKVVHDSGSGNGKVELSPEAESLAKDRFGVTDQDIAKYLPK